MEKFLHNISIYLWPATLPWACHKYIDDNNTFNCLACKCKVEKDNCFCSCCFMLMHNEDNMNIGLKSRIWSRDCPFCNKRVRIIGNWLSIIFGVRIHHCDFSSFINEFRVWQKLIS